MRCDKKRVKRFSRMRGDEPFIARLAKDLGAFSPYAGGGEPKIGYATYGHIAYSLYARG